MICTDVLEHIEPDCLQAVLGHLRQVSREYTFVNISTRAAVKSLHDGRNAHLADGVQRAIGREPRDFTDYARDAAASGVWEAG